MPVVRRVAFDASGGAAVTGETVDDDATRRVRIRDAAAAVAASSPPTLTRAIRLYSMACPTLDEVGDVEALLVEAVEDSWHADAIGPWWDAHADELRVSLCALVRDLDEVRASFLLGASVQARALGHADRSCDAVLRGAERAATWAAGLDRALLAAPSGFR